MTTELLFQVLLALTVVAVAGRVFGGAAQAIGQPPVVGEVLSGILLGPSLVGRVAPGVEAYLFPETVRSALGLLAHVGVVLYMFLVGLEFDTGLLRRRARSLVLTSQASMAVPFVLGCALARLQQGSLAPPQTSTAVFTLFMGVAMSITAFPVLARILTDRGMTRTPLGVAALTCAAINDVMAWVLLAVVVGVARAMPASGVPGELVMAFAIGVLIPHDSRFAQRTIAWLGGGVRLVLLPAFFALTGLRTEIGMVSTLADWVLVLVIVAVATAGKFGGATVAGRLSGMSWRFAARLGALMNTRGLMELIVLTVGLDAGIITPRLFTMMVIMALVTTAMTTPLLDLIAEDRGQDEQDAERRRHAGRDADRDIAAH